MSHDEAKAIGDLLAQYADLFRCFEAEGEELVIVGGAVRDLIAQAAVPAKLDVDFATSALPDKTVAILKNHKIRFFKTGIRFGTISALHEASGKTLEITTYRPDESYTLGNRKPEVSFGTSLEDDLIRRDLSINAMALRGDGTIVDRFGGREAIAARRLEVPGGGFERTRIILRDDPLRILRIARFAARLDFTPTEETTRAATECAPWLQSISHERWKAELDKLLVAPHPGTGLRWLRATGALPEVLDEASPLLAGAALDHWLSGLATLPRQDNDLFLRWASLLLGAATAQSDPTRASTWPTVTARQAMTEAVADRLKWSNEERAVIGALLALPFGVREAEAVSDLELRRWVAATEPHVAAQCSLLAALTPATERAALDPFLARVAALQGSNSPVPRLPQGFGRLLIQTLALSPGPAVGEAVDAVRDAIVDGILPNGAEAERYLDWLRDARR